MIRFLHTADWQIDKPFGGYGENVQAELRSARFGAVERLARIAREREAAFVLVAGDVFDSNTVSDRAIQRTLDAMAQFSGEWVLLPGNHDAAVSVSVWTRLERFRHGARIRVASEPVPIPLCEGRAVVLPAPLRRRHEGADVTGWFDTAETSAGAVRIGLAHGAVANRLPAAAESENPIADDRADRARLDYLALGDWHGFLQIAPRTYYAGTPEPDRYPANEPGFAALVEIDGPGQAPCVEKIATAHFRWSSRRIELHGEIEALDAALDALGPTGTTLLDLELRGTLPLRERVVLEERLDAWRARFHDLRVDDSGLSDEPDADDLDAIDLAGFVRVAVETLRRKAADPADSEREAAALALRMAFVDHARPAKEG